MTNDKCRIPDFGLCPLASVLWVVAAGLTLVACTQARKTPQPNANLPTVKKQNLVVGRDTVGVEVADNDQVREVGLMFRTVMAENEGMLFVFDSVGVYPFWMKNTILPLSIAFIDPGGAITDIEDMAPHDEVNLHGPHVPILYALEMNQGWYRRHNVSVGDTIGLLPRKEHNE